MATDGHKTDGVEIDTDFAALLPGRHPLANGAVELVSLQDGRLFLVSVGVVANPAAERTAAQVITLRRIALAKARAQLVEYYAVDVRSDTEVRTVARTERVEGAERLSVEESLDSSILQHAQSVLLGASIVGTWFSGGHSNFHLALALPVKRSSP